MYKQSDQAREIDVQLDGNLEREEYRTVWRQDYARLIHCPSFRRLQGKTQLYPGLESDFFRNRLTHSLEVAQISKAIAIRVNSRFIDNKKNPIYVEPDICEFAGLAHDLGHPPFGHQGEEALDDCMRDHGGFEGNAQTLRLLSRIEKKIKATTTKGNEFRYGLNLTFRSLAAILKYDSCIPNRSSNRPAKFAQKPMKGYYESEKELVEKIKLHVVGDKNYRNFKTVECQIMDIADDIAYSTYDLEDGLKAGFYNPIDILVPQDNLFDKVADKVSKAIKENFKAEQVKDVLYDIFKSVFKLDIEIDFKKITKEEFKELVSGLTHYYYTVSRSLATDGYSRSDFTSKLVGEFIRGIDFEYNKKYPCLSEVVLKKETRIKVEVLKNYTFESQILSPRLKVAEYRGKDIVSYIFKVLDNDGANLLPQDYQSLYHFFKRKEDKKRVICDFIAGMTDRYAIEFYGRLKSENPETIFKPF